MKKHSSILIAGLLSSAISASAAIPVVLFDGDGAKINECDAVKRIEIAGGLLTLVPGEGTTARYASLNTVAQLSFDSANLSGVADIANASTLNLSLSGDILTVEAPAAIASLTVYDASGKMVATYNPGVATATVAISGNGIFLVQTVVDNRIETIKIIK